MRQGEGETERQRQREGGRVTSPMSDLVLHRARRAWRAVSSNVSSPVSRLSAANSRMKVPTPAVHVTGVSVGLTPCRRFTVPYGMPVDVWNAAVHEVYGSDVQHQGGRHNSLISYFKY